MPSRDEQMFDPFQTYYEPRPDGSALITSPSGQTRVVPDWETWMTDVAQGRAFPYRLGAISLVV